MPHIKCPAPQPTLPAPQITVPQPTLAAPLTRHSGGTRSVSNGPAARRALPVYVVGYTHHRLFMRVDFESFDMPCLSPSTIRRGPGTPGKLHSEKSDARNKSGEPRPEKPLKWQNIAQTQPCRVLRASHRVEDLAFDRLNQGSKSTAPVADTRSVVPNSPAHAALR